MSKIATYSLADSPLQLSDRLIGTEAPRPIPSATPLATKNFSLGELLNLFSSNFPAASLQAVLNTGNTATQNITLVGTIDTTLIKPDNIEDTSGSQGLPFQFLSKGAVSINWVNLPVDNLQAVLNAGNTATQSITLIGNITSTRIIPGNIQDDTTGIGTTGQFLSKTASGIRWVNAPTSTTPGLGDVLSVGNTAINNINLTGNVTATSFIKTGGTNLQYLMADGSVTTGGGAQTLQQVTDAGNITTNAITVAGITSGNLYSDGFSFGISDNFDVNYNLYYLPYSGLQITNSFESIYINQDASIAFQTSLGYAGLRADLLTGVRTLQLPDASGTLALTSNIGTWGALNYPTWTTGTPFVKMTAAGTFALDTTSYYPYPIGTISQYIRGDGTLATLPSVTIPTLQQVTSAGNTTTDSIFLQSGLSPNSVILSNGYISLSNNITNRQISISISNDIAFSDSGGSSLYLKAPTTITATNTQTLQNASGTIALLSDIPTGDNIYHGTASGTDTYTVTISGPTAYNDGDAYLIRFTNGNTTGATLNINGLGAVPLYRNNDGPLLGGDVGDGGEMLCIYNSTLNEFQVIGISPNSLIAYITNDDSVTITKGQAVYAFSGTGDRMTVKLANNVGDTTSAQTIGLVLSTSIGPNQKGFIITQGLLDGLNILPTATYSDGDPIYLGSTAGSITNVKPYAPNHLVYLGIVTTASNGSSGRMYVKVQNGYELDELHNVQAQSPTLKDTLWYDNTVSPAQWKTASISTILGYTPVTNARTISTTTPLQGGGDLTANRTLSILQSSSIQDGYLSSTDWSAFNGKQNTISLTTTGASGASTFISNTLNIPTYTLSGLGGQPLATNLTSLSGLTYASTSFVKMTASGTFALDTNVYYLASNPSGFTSNTGTVTSVAALTLGTTGTDLSSTVANGTTTPVITLNVPTASAINRGVLSTTDWSAFNGKQNAITLTTTGSSGPATLVGATLNIPQYSGGGGGSSQVKLASQTLAFGSWTLVGSYYEYTFTNANIVSTGFVTFTPNNASINEVSTCRMLPQIDSNSGTCKFYSLFPPQTNIVGEIVIFIL